MFDTILLLLIAAALAPYLLGPFLVYFTQQWPMQPAFEPYDPIRHPLPDDLAGAFADSRDALAAAGFQTVADLAHANPISKLQVRVALLESEATGEHALVIAARSTNPKVKLAACYVELPTKFTDASTLSVTNSMDPEVYTPTPGRVIERFPQVRDPARLYRVSRALVDHLAAGRAREPLQPGVDPAAYVRAAIVREQELQLGTGYLRRDDRAQVFRPTLLGAWGMTYRLLPPFRQIREAGRRRRAQALLATLGLEGKDARPVAPPRSSDPMRWNLAVLAGLALLYLLVRGGGTGALADLSVPADFAGAVHALEELAGDRAVPLTGWDDNGERRPTPGVTVGVTQSRAEGLIAATREHFLARGFYLFVAERNFGLDKPDRLALFPRSDPYEIIELIGTNGANYGIDTDSVVTWFRALERDQPFIIDGIGFDWIGGRFTGEIRDVPALARRFHAFCPDIVEQGTGSVAALAREIRSDRLLYCWWD